MNDAIKFPLVLFIITAICGAILAGLYTVTQKPIEDAKKAKKEISLKEIFGQNAKISEPLSVATSFADNKEALALFSDDEKNIEYFKVTVDGVDYFASVGVTSKCYTTSSPLEIMVGISMDLKIKKIAVVKSSETPGLGENIKESEKDFYLSDLVKGKKEEVVDENRDKRKFLKMFNGISPEDAKIDKDGGAIIPLAGATITSRGVCFAVDNAVGFMKKLIEAQGTKPAE